MLYYKQFLSIQIILTVGMISHSANGKNSTNFKRGHSERRARPQEPIHNTLYWISKKGIMMEPAPEVYHKDDQEGYDTQQDQSRHMRINKQPKENPNSSSSIQHEIIENMISWVRSKGGYFNQKLDIRKMFPNKEFSPMGIFAKESIQAKESLMDIPRECYIDILDQQSEDMADLEDQEATDANHRNLCKLSHKLMYEMNLGQNSEYFPYLEYIKTQAPGQLPVNWSKPGKDLLRAISTEDSEMVDWIDLHFIEKGCITNDSFEVLSVERTVQRSFDTAFIPLWDMVNHDNGKWNTENDPMYSDGGLNVRASRDIKAGDEVFASYDLCVDCYDVREYWGTPEILQDFGFLEGYPHRWVFPEEDVWFTIESSRNGTLKVTFDTEGEDPYDVPDDESIDFMKTELKRLQNVGQTLLKEGGRGEVPEHEWNMIVDFHSAATTALSAGIIAAIAAA